MYNFLLNIIYLQEEYKFINNLNLRNGMIYNIALKLIYININMCKRNI